MYHHSVSIDEIIPEDVLQNILSYNPLSIAQKAVSKTFKRLCDKSVAFEVKNLNKNISEIINPAYYQFKSEWQYGSHWVVDPQRDHLNIEEIAIGYKGPLDLENTLKQCESGDTLLLSAGEHVCEAQYLFENGTSLSVIGQIGLKSSVVIQHSTSDIHLEQTNLYVNNVRLATKSSLRICIDDDAQLRMDKCTLSDISIHVLTDYISSTSTEQPLRIKNCDFNGNQNGEKCIKINVTEGENVQIVGCTFTGWGFIHNAEWNEHPVIELYTTAATHSLEDYVTRIAIIGNIFSNNKGRCVVFMDDNHCYDNLMHLMRWNNHQTFERSNVPLLRHNIIQNKTGRIKKQLDTMLKQVPQQFENPDPNELALGISTRSSI